MKQVVNGRVYNTDTAQYVCTLPCRLNRGDWAYHNTSLYRSPKGTFFLAGSGGPASMWREEVDRHSWGGGSGLRVLTDREALAYAESANLDPEAMIAAGFLLEEG